MATEAHILSDETVEPSLAAAAAPGAAPARASRPSLSARLQSTALGRAVHGLMQWAVVLGLIVTGYVGADLINSGIEMATRSDVPGATHILATSSPRN